MQPIPSRLAAQQQNRSQSPDLAHLTLALQAQGRKLEEVLSIQQKMLEHLIALAHAVDELAKPKPKPKPKPVRQKDRHPLLKAGPKRTRNPPVPNPDPEVESSQEAKPPLRDGNQEKL
jgi:hypothetical protein